MVLECAIEKYKDGEIVAFVKKTNKIVFKRANKKSKNNTFDTLLNYCFSMSKYFSKVLIKSCNILNEDQLKQLYKNGNVFLVDKLSDEMEKHISSSLNEIDNPTDDHLKIATFEYENETFIHMEVKSGVKKYTLFRHKRLREDMSDFIKRTLTSCITNAMFKKEKLNIYFSDMEKSNFELKDVALKSINKNTKKTNKNIIVNKMKELFDFDKHEFIDKNKLELDNKIKSSFKNLALQSVYEVNEEDIKQYNKGNIIYTDGAVFNCGGCGVGGVFVDENMKIINRLSLKLKDKKLTSNDCEMEGIYESLFAYKNVAMNENIDYIEIRTDSLNCAINIDKKLNHKRVKRVNALIDEYSNNGIKVVVRWNKGHIGIELNEMADILARSAIVDQII